MIAARRSRSSARRRSDCRCTRVSGSVEVCRISVTSARPPDTSLDSRGDLSGDLGRCRPRRERAVPRRRLGDATASAPRFPIGTLLVNVTGSFAIGLFLTLIGERLVVADWWRPLVAIGFLGSYTTFSTFSFETLALVAVGLVGTGRPQRGRQRRRMPRRRLCRHRAGAGALMPVRRRRRHDASRCSSARRTTSAIGRGLPRILEYLRREGAAGATVTRGVAGFGVHSRIHTASILDLSADLPIDPHLDRHGRRGRAPPARRARARRQRHRHRSTTSMSSATPTSTSTMPDARPTDR